MIPAPSYEQMDKILNKESFQFGGGVVRGVPFKVRTVGFVLFDQGVGRDSIEDFIQNLNMLHHHSGTYFHFFLCGISIYGETDRGAQKIGELDGANLYHNAKSAYSFVQAFERMIPGWRYDLGFELILVDIIEENNVRKLNYSSAVFFKVDEFIRVGLIDRPSQLVGKIVKISREGKFKTAKAMRDELQSAFGINWIKALILAMFPRAVGQLARTQAVLGGGASQIE